jgi:tetratricopeptide (TPR) repeat protein
MPFFRGEIRPHDNKEHTMKKIIVTAIAVFAIFAFPFRHGWRCLSALAGVFAKQKLLCIITAWTLLLCTTCATTSGGTGGLTLQDAIEQSADKIAADLKAKSAVAVVAFESEHDNLSAHIMEELNGALFDRGMVVIEREHLEYVQKELNYQLSGDVSDESARSIGKFFGAELVVAGRLTDLGDNYRYQVNAVHVETATRGSVARLDVANNRSMQRMVTALANQKAKVRVARYAVTEQTRPQTATEYLNKGIMYAMQGEYGKAIAEFDEALKINPNLIGAYMLRALALQASVSQVTGVEENFSGITTARYTGEQVSEERVRIYDRAIADYTQAIRLDPNEAGGYNQRGTAYAQKGDYDRAIADYTQAIRIVPNFSYAYSNRGAAYYGKGDSDRAIADYAQAIRLDPNNAGAYSNHGLAYYEKGDYEWAITDYTQALSLNPNNATVYSNRGVAYANKGDFDRAIADITQAIRLDPNNANTYINRGAAYFIKGDYDRAIADFTHVIRLDPDHIAAYYTRGNAYAKKGDADRAIADWTAVLRIKPDLVEALSSRGLAYASKGDFDRAIADWEAILRYQPNNADARRFIEMARRGRGY